MWLCLCALVGAGDEEAAPAGTPLAAAARRAARRPERPLLWRCGVGTGHWGCGVGFGARHTNVSFETCSGQCASRILVQPAAAAAHTRHAGATRRTAPPRLPAPTRVTRVTRGRGAFSGTALGGTAYRGFRVAGSRLWPGLAFGLAPRCLALHGPCAPHTRPSGCWHALASQSAFAGGEQLSPSCLQGPGPARPLVNRPFRPNVSSFQ